MKRRGPDQNETDQKDQAQQGQEAAAKGRAGQPAKDAHDHETDDGDQGNEQGLNFLPPVVPALLPGQAAAEVGQSALEIELLVDAQ
jgi:hypothetical protein